MRWREIFEIISSAVKRHPALLRHAMAQKRKSQQSWLSHFLFTKFRPHSPLLL
jgi:hypothetical protein